VLRVTNAHSSKIQNCFDHAEETRGYTINRLVDRVETGDIPADELFIGGEVAKTGEGVRLRELNAHVFQGIQTTAQAVRERIARLHDSFNIIAEKNGTKKGR